MFYTCFETYIMNFTWILQKKETKHVIFVGLSFPGLVLVFLFCSNFGLTPNIIHETHPGLEDSGIGKYTSSHPMNVIRHGDVRLPWEPNWFLTDQLEVRLPCSIRTFGLPMVAKQVLLHISSDPQKFRKRRIFVGRTCQEFADD